MIISAGRSVAEFDTMGAYLKSLALDGDEILLPAEDGRQTHGGACNLLPYAGRIRNGTYAFGGKTYSFPTGEGGHSIHGFAREKEFTAVDASDASVLFEAMLGNGGYPTTLDARIRYEIRRNSLSIGYDVSNKGRNAAPLVVGSHPYFLTKGDWMVLPEIPAKELHLSDRYFPDGTFIPFDFNRPLNGLQLDSCFEGGGDLHLKSDYSELLIRRRNMPYFLLYNGNYARGESVAIEPMTGAPDAYNNGMGVVILEPGGEYSCGYSITARKRN